MSKRVPANRTISKRVFMSKTMSLGFFASKAMSQGVFASRIVSKEVLANQAISKQVLARTKRIARHQSGEPFSSVSPTSTAHLTVTDASGKSWMGTVMLNNSEFSFSVSIVLAASLHASMSSALILIPDTYKFLPEDITVLKDDPDLPFLSQPTQANMVIEPFSPFCARLSDPYYSSAN
jgi:hypothetical protein